MKFTEGNKLGKGRSKGSKNQKVILWNEFGGELMKAGLPRVLEELSKLKGKDFLHFYDHFLNYFRPKNTAIELNATIERELPEGDELDKMIQEAYKEVYGNKN